MVNGRGQLVRMASQKSADGSVATFSILGLGFLARAVSTRGEREHPETDRCCQCGLTDAVNIGRYATASVQAQTHCCSLTCCRTSKQWTAFVLSLNGAPACLGNEALNSLSVRCFRRCAPRYAVVKTQRAVLPIARHSDQAINRVCRLHWRASCHDYTFEK